MSALLPTIGRRGGLEPIGLAALAAAPFVANLLSAIEAIDLLLSAKGMMESHVAKYLTD